MHLKCKFILFLIPERPHFRDNVTEIILDKHDCRTKSSTNSLFAFIWQFIRIVTGIIKKIFKYLPYSFCLSYSVFHLLVYAHFWRNFRPETGVLYGSYLFLRISIYMKMQHKPTKRCAQFVWHCFVFHTSARCIRKYVNTSKWFFKIIF